MTAVEGTSGGAKFSVALPSFALVGGRSPIAGSAMIAPDGNFYLPFSLLDLSGRETVNVLRVRPDGSHAITEVATAPACGIQLTNPDDIVPVTESEFLLLWRFNSNARSCTGSRQPAQIVRLSVSDGGVGVAGSYPLPPLTELAFRQPILQGGDMVVGEDGVVFATDGLSVVAFNSTTGDLCWTYQPPNRRLFGFAAPVPVLREQTLPLADRSFAPASKTSSGTLPARGSVRLRGTETTKSAREFLEDFT